MLHETPRVLYEDEALFAVNKPAGMLVHRGWDNDPVVLVDLVRRALGVSTIHPLHRLDRGTSGVVLFAKDRSCAAALGKAFHEGAVKKIYLALVRGVAPDSGFIDNPVPKSEGGKRVSAYTSYKRVAIAETEPRHVSLVEAIPKTGRLHQIRRHLKHISHPIIGDANYGKGPINRAMAKNYGLKRLGLHAASLKLTRPNGTEVEIEAPLPDDLLIPLKRMGFDRNLVWDRLRETG